MHLTENSNNNLIATDVREEISSGPTPVTLHHGRWLLRDTEVAVMLGVSPSTVRNRYNPSSEWYDPEFPLPITLGAYTGEQGRIRRAAVRWRFQELVDYINTRPRVLCAHRLDKTPARTKRPRTPKARSTPFRL